MGKIIRKCVEYGGSPSSAENIKYDDTRSVKDVIDEMNNRLTLDFSNASEDVQDVKALLQKLLDRFYPNVISEINKLTALSVTSSSSAWVYNEKSFNISSVENAVTVAFKVVSSNARVWVYGIKNGVITELITKDDGWNTSYDVNITINSTLYDSFKVKIGAFGSTTIIQDVICEII